MPQKNKIILLAIALSVLSIACLAGSANANPVAWPPIYSNTDIAYLVSIFAILEFLYFLLALLAFRKVSWVKLRVDRVSFVFVSLAMASLVMVPLSYHIYSMIDMWFPVFYVNALWFLQVLGVLSLAALAINLIYRWRLKQKTSG